MKTTGYCEAQLTVMLTRQLRRGLCAGPPIDVDALQEEAWHKDWRKYLLCFQSNQLEREFLELHAGKLISWKGTCTPFKA